MFLFLFYRTAQAIPVLLVVALISFFIFAFVGDPVIAMLGENYTEDQRIYIEQQLGLDQPILVQYFQFLLNIIQGNFGISYRLGQPVANVILNTLPATLELALVASLFSALIGIPAGVFAGIYRKKPLTRVVMVASLIGISLPTFLVGVLLILVFSVELGWLPSFGRGDVVRIGDWWTTGLLTASGLKSLILPAITLGLFQTTLIMRLVRSEMLEVLRNDYIKFARARGIPARTINFSLALKNTMIPVVTVFGLQIGDIIAFSIVTETVFQWPGMGFLFIQSIYSADLPVMSAYIVFIAVIFVIINLIVDTIYCLIDPRLSSSRGRRAV